MSIVTGDCSTIDNRIFCGLQSNFGRDFTHCRTLQTSLLQSFPHDSLRGELSLAE